MALLLVQGLAKGFRAAARQVAADGVGASYSAIVDRLRSAYSKHRADYERRARELLAAAAGARAPRQSPLLDPGDLAKREPGPADDLSSPAAKKLPD